MDGVEPQCRIKKDDKAMKRKIVGWKMSLMVSRLPDSRHRHPHLNHEWGLLFPRGRWDQPARHCFRGPPMQEHEEVGQSLSGTEPANYTLARHVACQIRGNLVQCQSVMFSHSCWQTEFYRKCVKSGKKESLTCNMSCRQHIWFPFLFTTPLVWLFATVTQGFPLQK